VTGGSVVLVRPSRGYLWGTGLLSDGQTPLPDAVVEILDAATGGLVRRFITGSDGRYLAQGLAPGSNLYVARVRTLGFADQFYPGVATRAAASPLTVTSGTDTPNINFKVTHSSDITGSVTYAGAKTGALRVRLFTDPGLTQQVYETVIPSPSLAGPGQPYGFMDAAPDTRGLMPGTYYVKAFLDGTGNGFQDPTEATG